MDMSTSHKNTHFRRDFDVGGAMVNGPGVSKWEKLSHPSDIATGEGLVGVVLDELNPTAVNRQRDKQYA